MTEPQVVTTLRRKRDEIERAIAGYEKKLAKARRDLAHVNATLRLFKLGQPGEAPPYVDLHRLFRRGEMATIAKAALAAEGELDTRELALRVIQAKGMDEADAVLRRSVAFRLVQALTMQAKRGTIMRLGKRNGVLIWRTR